MDIGSIPYLVINAARDQVLQLWHVVVAKLFNSMNGENDIAIVSQFFTTFYESLAIVGPESLGPEQMAAFINESLKHIKGYFDRLAERQGKNTWQ